MTLKMCWPSAFYIIVANLFQLSCINNVYSLVQSRMQVLTLLFYAIQHELVNERLLHFECFLLKWRQRKKLLD